MTFLLEPVPKDGIFRLLGEYMRDTHPQKVNLGIGIYSDQNGDPYVMPSIQEAAQKIDHTNFNYLPIQGDPYYLEQSAKLALGEAYYNPDEIAHQATCGGTQACRVFADLMVRNGAKKLLLGIPGWNNHLLLFESLQIQTFPHLTSNQDVNFSAYQEVIKNADRGDILLLQGGQTHNPTGKNLSLEQLEALLPLMKEKDLFVFVDFAYLGMGQSLEEDRMFLQLLYKNIENIAFALSYSKNACLYEHRTGGLFVKTKHKDIIESHLQNLIRGSISTPPGFGQEIMKNIFQHKKTQWTAELHDIQQDLAHARKSLIEAIPAFNYLADGRGMFGILQLDPQQIEILKKEHGVYILPSGRINFAGIKPSNVAYLKQAFEKVLA